jgi:hypothetical protein
VAIPEDTKDQAIYHTILSDLHRMRSILLNLTLIDDPSTAPALRDHFSREQNLVLARLTEWRGRRPDIYRAANEDFEHQVVRR